MRRLLAAALFAAAAVPLTSVQAQAATDPVGTSSATTTSPGGIAFTVSNGTLTAHDGPDGTHTATIDYSIYQPANATAATPAASLIMTHGFGLTKSSAEMVANASFFASHGYVVLAYTAQGFGASGGCIRLNSLDYDIKDEQQLLDVLQAKPFTLKDSKGLVAGVLGGSEGGGGVLLLTGADKRIRAAAPGRTWNTLDFSLDPNNYVAAGSREFDHLAYAQGIFKAEWTSLFFVAGNQGALAGDGGCAAEKTASTDPTTIASAAACPGFALQVCQTYAGLVATGDATDTDKALLARSGTANHIGDVTVPTLLVQGQSDTLFTENDALATYTQLQRQGVPVEMIWNWGGHGGYSSQPGECEAYDGTTRTAADMERCYLPQRTLAWMDHWVRGLPVETGPGFAWFSDWLPDASAQHGGSAVGSYGTATAYPAAPMTTYSLSGGSDLVPPGGKASAVSATFTNPAGGEPAAYTETANFTGPDASQSGVPVPGGLLPTTELPGQNVAFTAPAFTVDTDVVGTSRLHVSLTQVGTGDVYVFGKLYDVDASGTATLIHRQVAPSRIPSSALGAPVELDLPGIAHRFAKGHSLRVVLAATDQSYLNSKLPDVVTVTGGSVEVPILTAAERAAVVVKPGVKKPATKVRHVDKPTVAPTRSLAATGTSPLLALAGLVAVGAGLALRRRRV